MRSERSLIVVNYFSADLARAAIRTARTASSETIEVVIVDNSCDEAEWSRLESAEADHRIRADTNLGYSGGINAGARKASGNVLVVANPDVLFFDGSIDRLSEEVLERAAVAGPALFWDDACRWHLPPPEEMSRGEWFDRTMARGSRAWAQARDHRRTARRIRLWSAAESCDRRVVGGAVMAIRRDAFDNVGGFDQRYPLYFEEIDFQRRIRRSGGRIRHVATARCRHIYNQSAAGDESAQHKFRASEIEFHRRWHGERFVRLMGRLGGAAPALIDPMPADLPIRLPAARDSVVVEVGAEPAFDMAAGWFPSSDEIALPAEIVASYAGDALYVRVVDRRTASMLGMWIVSTRSGERSTPE